MGEYLVRLAAQLQFGHGSSAVETGLIPCVRVGSGTRLQFGHGSSAVETRAASRLAGVRLERFNSATALQPWKPAS